MNVGVVGKPNLPDVPRGRRSSSGDASTLRTAEIRYDHVVLRKQQNSDIPQLVVDGSRHFARRGRDGARKVRNPHSHTAPSITTIREAGSQMESRLDYLDTGTATSFLRKKGKVHGGLYNKATVGPETFHVVCCSAFIRAAV
jgi:hypothetical protein